MIDLNAWLAFAIASFLIVIVPGPTVTVIIANSLRAGSRAGLLNVAGTQLGILTMIAILAVGLNTVVAVVGEAFVVLKVAGALYLIWLGIKLWRADGSLGEADESVKARSTAGVEWTLFDRAQHAMAVVEAPEQYKAQHVDRLLRQVPEWAGS